MKTCNVCKIEKPNEEFQTKNNSLYYCCKSCKAEKQREYRKKNRTKLNESKRNRVARLKKTKPLDYYIKSSWTTLNQRCINGLYSSSQSMKLSPQIQSYHKKSIKLNLTKEQLKEFWTNNLNKVTKILKSGKNPMIMRKNLKKDFSIDNIKISTLVNKSGYKYNKDKKKIENHKQYIKQKETT